MTLYFQIVSWHDSKLPTKLQTEGTNVKAPKAKSQRQLQSQRQLKFQRRRQSKTSFTTGLHRRQTWSGYNNIEAQATVLQQPSSFFSLSCLSSLLSISLCLSFYLILVVLDIRDAWIGFVLLYPAKSKKCLIPELFPFFPVCL